MTSDGRSPEQEFLARLDGMSPDISGVGKVSLAEISGRMSLTNYRELAASRGWEVEGVGSSGGELVLEVKRAGSAPTTQNLGPEFIKGPSLSELRGNDVAREEAAKVLRETGIDVLSERTLDDARRRHLALRRKVVRLGWLSAMPALFAFTGLLFSLVLWREGDTNAGNVLAIVSLVAAGAFLASIGLPIKAEKSRKAAVSGYKTAYERVVSTALAAQRSSDRWHKH